MDLNGKKEKIALIHVARKELGLDELSYRALISGAAGVESSSDIKTDSQFQAVMECFYILGFKRKPPVKKLLGVQERDKGARLSDRQVYYIKGLWELASRSKNETGLAHLIKRIGKVDNIRFLDSRGATAVILTLKDMCRKAGFNPDKAGGTNHDDIGKRSD